MRKRINKAIAHTGLTLAGGGASGCFYFLRGNQAVENSTVWVSAMTHLPISRWVEEAEAVAKGAN